MERENSPPTKPRCHEKLVLDWLTFVMMAKLLENFFLFLRVTEIKKKVRDFLAPFPDPRPSSPHLHRGPKENRKRPSLFLSHQNMMARRLAILTLVHAVSRSQNMSHAFTHQICLFTKRRSPLLPHNLLRKPAATSRK